MSRPLLEWQLRSHLLKRSNVRIADGCGVDRLLVDRRSGRVLAVKFVRDGDDVEMAADLVVDAAGRGSRAPQWLEALGYPAVPVSEVTVNIRYATRIYRMPANPPDFKACILTSDSPEPRAGVLFPLEGGRWIVGMQGYFGNQPPTDEDGFLAFARGLPVPDIYNAIREAEPLSEIVPGGAPSNLRRHYEQMDRFPEGYVILGDAVCSFNPVYAQGMTTAAMGAAALGACLTAQTDGSTGLSRRFQQALAKAVDGPWLAAAGGDLAYPQAAGKRQPGSGIITWYMRRIALLCGKDPDVMRRFVKVMNLVEPPTVLFNLRTVLLALTSRP
jgi:2-polyprenyl-6-methoxyphenol hydroxylase-like FAD-dependent oxidoreductase